MCQHHVSNKILSYYIVDFMIKQSTFCSPTVFLSIGSLTWVVSDYWTSETFSCLSTLFVNQQLIKVYRHSEFPQLTFLALAFRQSKGLTLKMLALKICLWWLTNHQFPVHFKSLLHYQVAIRVTTQVRSMSFYDFLELLLFD